MRISKMLKIHRVSHDLTQAELADGIGITKSEVSQIERGKAVNTSCGVLLLGWLLTEEPEYNLDRVLEGLNT